MGKKLEVLRRSESKDSLNSVSSRGSISQKLPWRLVRSPSTSSQFKVTDSAKADSDKSSLRSFFNRIGSTSVLYNADGGSGLGNGTGGSTELLKKPDTPMYRSLSTSQLVSSSYVKGDDPADYISDAEKDTSCSYEENLHTIPSTSGTSNYVPTKTVSCDNISAMNTKVESTLTPASRKASFPYAFLRSKLSVLPEENGGSVLKSFARPSTSPQKYSRSPSLCCKFEYKRSSSYVSSNESGYDSDSARVSEKSETCETGANHSNVSDGDNNSLVAQSTSDNNDNDSDFVDGIGDFELDQLDTCKLLDLPGMYGTEHRLEGADLSLVPSNASENSKILNTPSMNLFYKKNEYLKNRCATEEGGAKPKFTRHMFIKNSTRRELCRYTKNNLSKSYEQDLSSLPSTVNDVETQHRYKLIRLIKNTVDEDLGIYLTMKIHRLTKGDHELMSREARYVVVKLEPEKIAEK